MNRDQASLLIAGRDWKTPTFFRVFMPYVYKRVEVPGRKHAFLPLNREYMPLGVRRAGPFDYADAIQSHAVYFSRDPALLTAVWHNSQDDGAMMWLYDDDPESRRTYFERFWVLCMAGMVA